MLSSRHDGLVSDLRQQVFRWFDLDSTNKTSKLLNRGIRYLITTSIVIAVLATEPVVRAEYIELLTILDGVIASVFAVEYLLRLWIAPLKPGAQPGFRGVAAYAMTPMALLDLLAIAPTILGIVSPELYLLRIFRLVRIGRIGRSKKLQKSIKYFNQILSSKKEELQISAIYSAMVIGISSIAMYLVEGKVQQDQFGSIPRCLWWAVITVTTVGYGDTVPTTVGGRLVASITAISGIAVIAIPIGIISAGFTEAWSREQSKKN